MATKPLLTAKNGWPTYMSMQAMVWALEHAPDVPAQALGVLMGLANHADERGRGAYAGQELLAEYARKSDRQTRTDLARLEDAGLIRRGDQGLVAHLRADKRPVVWDLAMERVKGKSDRKSVSGRKETSARKAAPKNNEGAGKRAGQGTAGGSTPPGGSQAPAGSTASSDRKRASDKPVTEPKPSLPTEEKGATGDDPDSLFDAPKATAARRKPRKTGPSEPDERDIQAEELTKKFWERHRTAQPFPAVRGVVRTALGNGYSRDELAFVLDRLGKQGMAISGATITIAHSEIAGARGATGRDAPPGNGSGSQVPPRGTPRQNPFPSKRETA
jgi:hypothetical protein